MKNKIIQNFFEKDSKGFTLLELLVVFIIIAIVSSILLVNYRNTGQQFAVQRSAHKLAQDIRRASEMAMAAQECCGGIVPPGYGIFLQGGSSNYILYADTQPSSGNEFYTSADSRLETINLESGVTIQSIDSPNNRASINFKPPSPITRIKYQVSSERNIVTITLGSSSYTKRVIVNVAGLIEIE